MDTTLLQSTPPGRIFLTKGVGTATTKLVSFELALRNAGISQVNLVRVSSIYPPYCKVIPAREGAKELQPGAITFCVLSENSTNEPGQPWISSNGTASGFSERMCRKWTRCPLISVVNCG